MSAISSTQRYQQPAAYRERRFADIIDAALVFGVIFLGVFANLFEKGWAASPLTWQMLGLLTLFGLQAHLLLHTGKTVGKKFMQLRVVTADTGEHPSWVQLLLLRPLSIVILALPLVGRLVVLIDRFLVFRGERRTVEDLISGTKLVSDCAE